MFRRVAPIALVLALTSALGATQPAQSAAASYGFRIVNVYPHDSRAYTQGLVFLNGVFYESTGLNGRSSIRKVRIETGEVLQRQDVDVKYFGEGLAHWQGKLFQLTWQTHVGFVYDLATFKQERTFPFTGEGWGLATSATHFIMSDGTADLRFLDPVTLKESRRLPVRDGTSPVAQLNELEVVRGEVFANIYQTDRIARINPQTGRVTGWIDLTGLLSPADRAAGAEVLNGIAYDAAADRLFVTGKLWPKVFEIRLERRMK
jgi:glutaminyl-peptide cyclotransferase